MNPDRIHKITLQGSGQDFPCARDDSILRAGLRAGYGLSYECNVGSCGSCKFMVIDGEVEALWPEAPGLTQRDHARGVKLACQSQPRSDCIVKVIADNEYAPQIRPHRFMGRFISAHAVTHDMREFIFQGPGSAEFLPGQYCLFAVEGVSGLRAYSMSNNGNGQGLWSFVIRRVPNGAATSVLFDDIKPSDEISLDAPYGLAHLRTDNSRDVVCIAGGAGISPMLSIAAGIARDKTFDGRSLHFFFGGREPRDICGESRLSEIPELRSRSAYYASISAPDGNPHGEWTGERGFVHELVSLKLAGDFKNYEYYLAGPSPMIQAVLKLLMFDHKVPRGQIHYDRFF
jgi:toluene monooxygenase electron transfer component